MMKLSLDSIGGVLTWLKNFLSEAVGFPLAVWLCAFG